jgi:hypothetical protein
MASFLVTRKMSPELAARVEASVRGQRTRSGSRVPRRTISLFRALALVSSVGLTAWLLLLVHRSHQALAAERATLVARVQRESAALTERQKALVPRVQAWLSDQAGAYAGDSVVDELRGPTRLAAMLTRPAVYIRGPLASFTSPATIAATASASFKDAFVLCLVDPPASRTEKSMLTKARVALAHGPHRAASAHIERLYDAIRGLPFLAPAWESRVLQAETRAELAKMRAALEHAPLRAAQRAAKAQLLLFVIDEPGAGPGPTELDGERAHHIRLGLWDLTTEKLLLRLRRHVDPNWISSPVARAEYASGMDACALAYDVRAELAAATLSLAPPGAGGPDGSDVRRLR